jgi:hypothetical protein
LADANRQIDEKPEPSNFLDQICHGTGPWHNGSVRMPVRYRDGKGRRNAPSLGKKH